ncbi:SHOCT domain-containing protein [Solirubrobacter soli]|uniref:SHOCT domain-containing protein n=1 Tax=Solirubrobacter soli TaxID=363832 RepID=UPI000426D802|nr:SHOCT domain-containing protein [Solirubrobacter soli]
MPGLLRGVARTAVVAGTATAVSNRVSRRQVNRWGAKGELPGQQQYAQPDPYQQAPPQQYAPPPEPPEDPVQQLRELAKLRDDGILTEEEFAAEKRKILG